MTFMSSPKAARGKAKRATPARKTVVRKKPAAKAKPPKAGDVSAQARQLAALLERSIVDGNIGVVSEAALQNLMAALCKTYSARVEAGDEILPLRGRTAVSSTDIMTTASGLLKAANLAVFELGMWQSWTGR
jgi:hypothetical protein